MKYLKKFENYDSGWIIPLNNEEIDPSIFKKIPDISDKVIEGDIVIGVWFSGGYDIYLLKVEKNDDGELGVSNDYIWYGIDHAWGIFDPEDYNKYAEKSIDLIITTKQYNL